MKKRAKTRKKVPKWLFWTPRILTIAFVAFISLFALDVFSMSLGFWGTIVGLFMHLIPSILLLIVLLISWKYEIVGGVAFILAGLFHVFMSIRSAMTSGDYDFIVGNILIISGPIFLIGILFFMNWGLKKRR